MGMESSAANTYITYIIHVRAHANTYITYIIHIRAHISLLRSGIQLPVSTWQLTTPAILIPEGVKHPFLHSVGTKNAYNAHTYM